MDMCLYESWWTIIGNWNVKIEENSNTYKLGFKSQAKDESKGRAENSHYAALCSKTARDDEALR